MAGYKTLDVTLISASNLKNASLIGKMDVYVVAYLSTDPNSKQKTPIHHNGGTSPRWNHTVRLTFHESSAASASLVFQLKHKHTFGSDADLGQVRVPLADLLAGSNKDAQMTYQIRRPSGKPGGELVFSYRLNDAVFNAPPQYKAAPVAAYPPQVTAYPPQQAAGYPPPQMAYPQAPPYGGYGYGYGYPVQVQQPQQMPQRVRRNGGMGMGLGAGLLGGALGGLLIGDMISDSHGGGYDGGYDGGGYDGGYDGGFDDGGGDFGGMDF